MTYRIVEEGDIRHLLDEHGDAIALVHSGSGGERLIQLLEAVEQLVEAAEEAGIRLMALHQFRDFEQLDEAIQRVRQARG